MLHLLVAILLLTPFSPISSPSQSEEIKIFLSFDICNFTQFFGSAKVEIRSINLHELNSSLPERYVYADEIRENLNVGNISLEDIRKAYLAEISQSVEGYISSLFGNTYSFTEGWDESSLHAKPEPPLDEPPIVYYINYTLRPWFGENVDDELIIGLLNDGAVYRVEFRPFPTKYPTIINITLPFGTLAKDFPLPTNGTINGRNYYTWEGWREVKMVISGAFSNSYSNSKVNISVLIDMHTLTNEDGKEYLYTSINLSAFIYVLPIPKELRLPENFEMHFISADGIRLVIAKNVVNLTYINEVLNSTIEIGKEKIAQLFNSLAFELEEIENLTWEGEPTKMDCEPPIAIFLKANSKLDFGDYIKNYRQALALTYTYQLSLVGVEGFNITYTIVFPRNVEVVHVDCRAPHEKIYVNAREGVLVYIGNSSELLKVMIRISFGIDFERLYPFLVLLGILIGIWIGVSIIAWRKKRMEE